MCNYLTKQQSGVDSKGFLVLLKCSSYDGLLDMTVYAQNKSKGQASFPETVLQISGKSELWC